MRAHNLWRDGSGWKLKEIELYVPQSIRLDLTAIVLDRVTRAGDRLSWGEASNGEFTVRSAYDLLMRIDTPRQNMERFYKQVWQVVAPERVRVFLWLVGQQVIMTNVERVRRHIGNSSICQVCREAEEDIMHVLRDCPAMEGIWRRIVPVCRR